MNRACALAALISAGISQGALAQLATIGQFSSGPSNVGLGYDPSLGRVYTYPSFGSTINRFTAAGAGDGSIPRPGGSGNDADVEIASVAFTLGSTFVPAGSVLYIDGESGVAEIYASTPSGTFLGSLTTAFGVSHVVGGAYHPTRGTLFLVQDGVPGGSAAHRVAEINAVTGAVINTWQITAVRPTFTVNFGDLDSGPNGNLFVVSSDEGTIAELTPGGAFVAEYALPSGVNNLCGIGFDLTTCEAWVTSTGGVVSHLRGFPSAVCTVPCEPDLNQDGNVDQDDVSYIINVIGGGPNPTNIDPDFNHDGNADQDDVLALIGVVAGAACP